MGEKVTRLLVSSWQGEEEAAILEIHRLCYLAMALPYLSAYLGNYSLCLQPCFQSSLLYPSRKAGVMRIWAHTAVGVLRRREGLGADESCSVCPVGPSHEKLNRGCVSVVYPKTILQERSETETTQEQTIQRKFLMFQPLWITCQHTHPLLSPGHP